MVVPRVGRSLEKRKKGRLILLLQRYSSLLIPRVETWPYLLKGA